MKWIDIKNWEHFKEWEKDKISKALSSYNREKMSRGMEELLEDEEGNSSPDTIIMGEGILEQMRNHKPRQLTKKEFEELYNQSNKPQKYIIWTSAEKMIEWEALLKKILEDGK